MPNYRFLRTRSCIVHLTVSDQRWCSLPAEPMMMREVLMIEERQRTHRQTQKCDVGSQGVADETRERHATRQQQQR